MKAKCPHCDKGCEKCEDGYFEANFPGGPGVEMYTRRCLSCDEVNGGRFTGPKLPPLPQKPGQCVFCGSDDVIWELVGDADVVLKRVCRKCQKAYQDCDCIADSDSKVLEG